jgi:hypothetical protein
MAMIEYPRSFKTEILLFENERIGFRGREEDFRPSNDRESERVSRIFKLNSGLVRVNIG